MSKTDSDDAIFNNLNECIRSYLDELDKLHEYKKSLGHIYDKVYLPLIGDRIEARFLFSISYTYVPKFKAYSSTNQLWDNFFLKIYLGLMAEILSVLDLIVVNLPFDAITIACLMPDFFSLSYMFLRDLLEQELGLIRENRNIDLYCKWFQTTPADMLIDSDRIFVPETVVDLWEAGVRASEDNDMETAIQLFLKGLSIEPENVMLLNSLGFVLHSTDSNDQALDCFNKALVIAPEDGLIYKNRGMVNIELGNYVSALDDLDRSIELSPGLWGAVWFRARAQDKLGQYEAAIQGINDYLDHNPECHQLLEHRARIHWNNERNEDALKDIQRAIDASPDSVEYLITAGYIADSASLYQEPPLPAKMTPLHSDQFFHQGA